MLTLDVLSFRSSKRAVDALRPLGIEGRLGFVVNRASRAEITPKDVVRVFGCEPLAVVPLGSSRCPSAGSRALVGARSRTGRAFDRLAGACWGLRSSATSRLSTNAEDYEYNVLPEGSLSSRTGESLSAIHP